MRFPRDVLLKSFVDDFIFLMDAAGKTIRAQIIGNTRKYGILTPVYPTLPL
jgi:hypothetical protein